MTAKKVLFISGSLGLGHIARDIAIAGELRKRSPDVEISWLASHPATTVLEEAGEKLHPEAGSYANDNVAAEAIAGGFGLSIVKYVMAAKNEWKRNFITVAGITAREKFDAVIGDETYEISMGLRKKPEFRTFPFVMIYDFCGLDAMSASPTERIAAWMVNRSWSQGEVLWSDPKNVAIFIGEIDDVPDRPLGFMLPSRREVVRRYYKPVGHILPFDPADFTDRESAKSALGYGGEPLIVCSIGGTSVGKPLLELCAAAFPLIREKVPDAKMLLVCGPRLDPSSLHVPEGVEVKGYVPGLYRHLAACDLAIVQGGGTVTLELTALRRPFLYFPVEGHCEQQLNVAYRLRRLGAGTEMTFADTSPGDLAVAAAQSLGKEVSYPAVPTNGAAKAAELILPLL